MTRAPRLADKRILVTGGTRGLGLAMARACAAAGARVAITYAHNDDDADEAAAQIEAAGRPDVRVFKGSVVDADHVKQTVAALVEAWEGIDVLINAAGRNQVLPVALLEEADWDEVMAVNVKGTYLFSRAVLKPMIRQRAGHILTIGNFASERVVDAPVHYAASKSALRGFTESLAREVGRYNVRVNLLAPGLLDVGLSAALPRHRLAEYESRAALGRLGTAEEVAAAAVFLVSDENAFMTGAKIVLDGGL